MRMTFFFFIAMALALGWTGTRMAFEIHRVDHKRIDKVFMLALCWSPLVITLLALVLNHSGSTS